jgi:clan AA aspartic protease
MEKKSTGRVIVPIKVENAYDVEAVELGEKTKNEIRHIEVDALVDTGSGLLCLNRELIDKLGLRLLKEMLMDTATGSIRRRIFKNARLTIMGRSCPIDVVEVASKHQALVGYLPLEALDLAVDPKAGKVTFNPEHGDEMILDLL